MHPASRSLRWHASSRSRRTKYWWPMTNWISHPARAKLKFGGSHAGHNGLRDIHAQLGTDAYWRLRLGIGHPGNKAEVVQLGAEEAVARPPHGHRPMHRTQPQGLAPPPGQRNGPRHPADPHQAATPSHHGHTSRRKPPAATPAPDAQATAQPTAQQAALPAAKQAAPPAQGGADRLNAMGS